MSPEPPPLTIADAIERIDELTARVEHLHEALHSHDLVWRAKTWLAHDLVITPGEAHELIWHESSTTNTKVSEIARRIVDEHEPDAVPERS